MRGLRASFVLALALASCGGSAPPPVGVSAPRARPEPLELTLRAPDGRWLDVGDLRGHRVVIFLFATFDGTSQAALRPLSRLVRHRPDVYVVGVAAQPDARDLLEAWAAALSPPFPVAYDPDERVSRGTSNLGALDAIPSFVVLDEDGFVVARHSGYASESRLDALLARER